MSDLNGVLETMSQVLWRCTLWGVIILLMWASAFWLLKPLVMTQAMVFGVNSNQACLINYALMGFMKVIVLVFFLGPFIAIRRILRKRRSAK